MSNLIVLPFIGLVIVSLILLISGKATHSTKQRIWGFVLLGIAFSFFGIACIVGTKLSAQPQVTGVLTNLHQNSGARHKSLHFQVCLGDHETHTLSCPYNGSSLQEGQTVFVRYLEFDHSVLDLRVLDGSDAGFSYSQSASPWSGAIMILIGMAGFYCGYAELCKSRRDRHLQST